jgi:hypothetical protein
MAWLSSLETTLTSPQARTVMAEALRAIANVLEKPQGSDRGQGSGAQEGQNAVSAEEVSAPRSLLLRWRSPRQPSEPQGTS